MLKWPRCVQFSSPVVLLLVLHSPELLPKCMNTSCTDHFLMIAVCAHSRRLPEVIFLVFSNSSGDTYPYCLKIQKHVVGRTSSRRLFFNQAFYFSIKKQQMTCVPWQKTHHDISISCRGSATSCAVCIGPGSDDRRVSDTAAGREYEQIFKHTPDKTNT